MHRAQSRGRFLTPEEASRVYDRIGRFQDWQTVYEGRAIRELIRPGAFDSAKSIFEFGCGTGAFAAKLFTSYIPPDCRYVGIDLSRRMVELSTSRLKPWAGRAEVKLADGSPLFHEPDGAFDRVVSNYVFDLLAPEYAVRIVSETHRILSSSGKLCLVSLARGTSGISKIVTAIWEMVWRLKPEFVGGCRPVSLGALLPTRQWSIEHHTEVVSVGITSEVLVASRLSE